MSEKNPNNFEWSNLKCKSDPETKRIHCVIQNPTHKQTEEEEKKRALSQADAEIKKL